MLFSAGMGIGLFFYGVVEPLSHHHFTLHEQGSMEEALSLTMLHWGIHPWSCYAMTGLCFAYFSFRKRRPFSICSCLHLPAHRKAQLIFKRVIEVATVVCPVVGVASSLGLGSMQITKGLSFGFDWNADLIMQITVVTIITILSTFSVVSGVEKGMKFLSILNMFLAAILLLCIFYFVSPWQAFRGIVQDFTHYLTKLPQIAWWSAKHDFIKDGGPVNWTPFHWSAWIAWAPFVGMFIAKISRGRTIREFLTGVILVPTLLSVIWFSLLGRSGMSVLGGHSDQMRTILENDLSSTFFLYLNEFSGSLILYGLVMICLKLFFITSSDSAALVIATSAAEGKEPGKYEKVYWSVAISLLAMIFLVGGGLGPMQLVTIISAAPFAMISLFMIGYFLWDIWRVQSYSVPAGRN